MRQTRRSRSTAVTPQNASANQVEEVPAADNAMKTLETVPEKESDVKEEVGSPVEPSTGEMQVDNGAVAEPFGETEAVPEKPTTSEECAADPIVEKENQPVGSPVKAASSPQKTDSGAIELDCKVCNVSFTNYQQHMNGEPHKTNISSPNAKPEGQSNVEKSAGQAQKRSGDQVGAPSPKRMRGQSQTAQNTSAEKFTCDVCKITMHQQQDFDFHMNGKRHSMNVSKAQGKVPCDICKLFFNTLEDLNDHSDSQLHKNNLAEKKQDKQPYECKVCKTTSIGQRQHEQHLASKRHKRSLVHPVGSTPTKVVNGRPEPKVGESQKKWLYLCNACNFGCSQDEEFSSHINLADHKTAVTDMKKKGLVLEKGAAGKPAAAKPAAAAAKPAAGRPAAGRPAAAKPAGAKPVGLKPLMGPNAVQNVRKFQANNATGAARNLSGPAGPVGPAGVVNKPPQQGGPVTKVSYNLVNKPNANNTPAPAAAVKPGPVKKDVPQANRKPPVVGAGGPAGPRKNIPANKPPMGGRPNPRFQGQPADFAQNAQPMNVGYQKMQSGNFGPAFASPEPNYGTYGTRPGGSYSDNMRNNNGSQGVDARDFRGNMREEYTRDMRDIRDIRNIELGDNRVEAGFRSGFYRDVPAEAGRNVRGDYGTSFRGEMPLDARSDMRPGLGSALAVDTRGDVRSMVRSDLSRDMGSDLRNYGNSERDLRNDVRGDFIRERERSTMSGYGGSAAYSQQSYRSSDDYRSDNYGRAGQTTSGQGVSTGNYSSGMMAGNRYDFLDRNSAYSNQFSGSSRGIGYMGDMSLNGR